MEMQDRLHATRPVKDYSCVEHNNRSITAITQALPLGRRNNGYSLIQTMRNAVHAIPSVVEPMHAFMFAGKSAALEPDR